MPFRPPYILHTLFPLLKMPFPSSLSSNLSQYNLLHLGHDFGVQWTSVNLSSSFLAA